MGSVLGVRFAARPSLKPWALKSAVMASLVKRLWAWVVGPRAGRAFYPGDEPKTRRERQGEVRDSAENPADRISVW